MKKIFGFGKRYFVKHKLSMGILFLVVIASGLCTLMIPIVSGNFIDFLVKANNSKELYIYCILFGALSGLNIIIGYIANRVYTKLNYVISFDMAQSTIKHGQKLNVLYFFNKSISRITQQISSDTKTITDFCFDFLSNAITNTFQLIFPLIIIFKISKSMFAIILILILVYTIAYITFKKVLYKANYEVKEKQNIYFSNLYEQVSKVKFIKTHGVTNWFNKRVEQSFYNLLTNVMKLQTIQYSYSALDTCIMTVGQICLFLIGGFIVLQKRMTIGQFTIVLSYFNMGIAAIRYYFGLGQKIQITLVSYERIEKINTELEEMEGSQKIVNIEKITVSNLKFSFERKEIIHGLDIVFEMGKSYALMGQNGVGKTTLCNIIIGLYQNYEGDVLYNDFSIKKVNLDKMRKDRISVIEQEPELIQDTLYKNIVLDKSIPQARVRELLDEWLGKNKFLDQNMKINDNSSNLSGGEKEKIAIIRAILKNSDLIIMDEPTAALDAGSHLKLKNLIKTKWKDKIVIVITHDQEFAGICDNIIYL